MWVRRKTRCTRRMWLAWFAIAPVQQTVGRTLFDEEVKAQWIYQQEEPEKVPGGVGFAVPLGNDRKRSVGKFKEAKTKARARRGCLIHGGWMRGRRMGSTGISINHRRSCIVWSYRRLNRCKYDCCVTLVITDSIQYVDHFRLSSSRGSLLDQFTSMSL
jgi:hypothetical protein